MFVFTSRAKACLVHLSDGRGSNRGGWKVLEQLFDLLAQIRFDDLSCFLSRIRSDVGMKLRQLTEEGLTEQVHPRGEQLAELYECWPQTL